MERISIRLELHGDVVSQKWIEDNVDGKGKYLRKAIDVLADEGYVTRTRQGGAYKIETIRPYREDDDQAEIDPGDTSSRPRPDLVPTLTSTPVLDLVPAARPHLGRGGCEHDSFWLARDGIRRCVICEPPAFPSEAVAEAIA
jgi:hypothetical protein